jgi:hypothetical protein
VDIIRNSISLSEIEHSFHQQKYHPLPCPSPPTPKQTNVHKKPLRINEKGKECLTIAKSQFFDLKAHLQVNLIDLL